MRTRGFTLIELSIVLVIIGLIVGGILAGRELIKSAEMKSLVTQIEDYRAAVNTFRLRYRYLPGDLPNSGSYGLSLHQTPPGQSGDGNGLILDQYGEPTRFYGEPCTFWTHLGEARLIKGQYTCLQTGATVVIGMTVPTFYRGYGVGIYAEGAYNYFRTGVMTQLTPGAFVQFTEANLFPGEAFFIDSKTDDGAPNMGRVMEGSASPQNYIDRMPVAWDVSVPATRCISGLTAAATYELANTAQTCNLRIMAGF